MSNKAVGKESKLDGSLKGCEEALRDALLEYDDLTKKCVVEIERKPGD